MFLTNDIEVSYRENKFNLRNILTREHIAFTYEDSLYLIGVDPFSATLKIVDRDDYFITLEDYHHNRIQLTIPEFEELCLYLS